MTERFDVTVVGSGFAGSILARALARRGLAVALIERDRHPRFALGESSTPLAAIALERLAERYDLPDLRALAAHGPFRRELPALRCGLKRGFTFYGHGAGPPERSMVAASPNDEVADVHWLRADVDAHLAEAAAAAGAELRQGVEARSVEDTGRSLRLRGGGPGGPLDVETTFLVDATGPGGFATRALRIPPSTRPGRLSTALIYGHFEGVDPFEDEQPAGPYPGEWSAVHHLLPEGWMYSLRFDDGLTSAGFELVTPPPGTGEPAFRGILGRYPRIARCFSRARAVGPVGLVPKLQFRLARSTGPRYLLLPAAYAFTSPLFSTGIAWSLRGVERALRLLANGPPGERALAGYHGLLAREAEWVDRLVKGALAARTRFGWFVAWSLLYFVAASFAEARERLLPEPTEGWAAEPFLGAGHPLLATLLGAAESNLAEALAGRMTDDAFAQTVRGLVQPLDVAGFSLPRPDGSYPLDLEILVDSAEKLGTTRESVRASLPRLRGVQ